jgi:cephalosporin-C deacetylase
MPWFDLPHDQLTEYQSSAIAPPDLEEFWEGTLIAARSFAVPPLVERVECGLRTIDVFDVTFSGFGGDPIRAWYQRPAGVSEALPIVVRYQGYGDGRGLPHQTSIWPHAGYAVLEVDTRGQGTSAGRIGHTADSAFSGPAVPGYLTRGITDRDTYYYRRVFTDAVRAVETCRTLPGVDPSRIVVAGSSQGGGIALAVSGLDPNLVAAVPDVPFLSDFRRAAELAIEAPYTELVAYLAAHPTDVDSIFNTLGYFDPAILVRRANAPAIFSVGLMDTICPPSTVYAAYNAYGGEKSIHEYPYNKHEGGHAVHQALQMQWLDEHIRSQA